MQQPCSEYMASFRIGTELDLIDRQEVDRSVERHGFNGAHEIGRGRWRNLLLAGNQGHRPRTLQLDDPVINLSRQQPQREPDCSATVAEHTFDGEVSLAGISRPEDRDASWSEAKHGHRH